MITLKELAARCNVSIATVSNILNGKTNVSEATKQKVLQAIKETGYRPSYIARSLRASKTKTIGLIIDELSAFSSPALIEGVLTYLESKNYKAIIETLRLYSKWGNQPYTEDYKNVVMASVNEMLSIKVDGIIYVAAHAHDVDYFPTDLPVPIVISYAFQSNSKIPSLRIDDETAGYDMTKYLISKGHKKIAIIAGEEQDLHGHDRLVGFERAMKEAGLPVDKKLFEAGKWSRGNGYLACQKLFEKSNDFTAIFCFNDLMAAGCYDYLYEIGKVPGKDIAVAGFDNREIADFLTPPLTTMAIPLYEIGGAAAYVLLQKINGADAEYENHDERLPCRLIERKSVCEVK